MITASFQSNIVFSSFIGGLLSIEVPGPTTLNSKNHVCAQIGKSNRDKTNDAGQTT
jgi:hypothetical protein